MSTLRVQLYQETLARPYLTLPVPSVVEHVLYWKGDSQSTQLYDLAMALATRQGVTPKSGHSTFFEYQSQNYHIRFEQHTEFDTLTIAQSIDADAVPFSVTPLDIVDEAHWAGLEEDLLVKTRVHLRPTDTPKEANPSYGEALFSDIHGGTAVYGSWVMEQRGEVYTDFRLDAQGFVRYMVLSHTLNAADAGRLVTRLIEMENYRILALIPVRAARTVGRELTDVDARLSSVLDAITRATDAAMQHECLDKLLEIAKQVESNRNQVSTRFSASQAYYEIVKFSLDKLGERKIGNLQRLQTFVERRLGPATRSFTAMRRRLEDISQRTDRIAELLRTEINLQMQVQSGQMLANMNHNAAMQLKMQKTVEGISIVALTYYAISVLGYVIGIFVHGEGKYTIMGLLVLPVAVLIWYVQRKLVHKISRAKK